MKPTYLIASAILPTAGFATPSLSVAGMPTGFDLQLPTELSASSVLQDDGFVELIRQGRGRGRSGDRDRDDDRGGRDDRDDHGGRSDDDRGHDDDRSSGRDRPRIPGGSGCDDPHDLIEHPECRV